jgi:hypothetical protein
MAAQCRNCKYWGPVPSIRNWGNCTKNSARPAEGQAGPTGGVLRRYHESCPNFERLPSGRRRFVPELSPRDASGKDTSL